MAKKGGTRHENRLMGASTRTYAKKAATFGIRSEPGPHARKTSAPLGDILKDMGVGRTSNEIRRLLNRRVVKVNDRVRTAPRFPVGLFDLVSVDGLPKPYRMIIENHGRLVAQERQSPKAPFKLSKVKAKTMGKEKTIRLTTTDGENWRLPKTDVRVNDTVKWTLSDRKIVESFKLESGNAVLVTGGQRRGSVATIEDIVPGTVTRPALVRLKPVEGNSFQTTVANVFVIGPKGTQLEW